MLLSIMMFDSCVFLDLINIPSNLLYLTNPFSSRPILFYSVVLCSAEVLTPTEHAARLQKSEVLEECEQDGNQCYTLQSVEKVMKQVSICSTIKHNISQH